MPCFHRSAPQRTDASGEHRDLGSRGDVADEAGVAQRQRCADVARDGGDTCDIECITRGECERQHHGVVDTGIAIDDDAVLFHGETLYEQYAALLGVIDAATHEA